MDWSDASWKEAMMKFVESAACLHQAGITKSENGSFRGSKLSLPCLVIIKDENEILPKMYPTNFMGRCVSSEPCLPDVRHPELHIGQFFPNLINDVQELVPRLVDPLLHLRAARLCGEQRPQASEGALS